MLIDTHAHLQDEEFAQDRREVFERARSAKVQSIVLVGENLENSRLACQMAAERPSVYSTAGVHPHHASQWDSNSQETLRALLAEKTAVGLGEIGLDYHYDFSPRDQQRKVLAEQLQIALELRKPVVVHCREAYDEMLPIAEDFAQGWKRLWQTEVGSPAASPPPGVMHCFFGSLEQAFAYTRMGFMLGIGGAATFKKAEELHEVVRRISIEHLVLETDAPYMAPVPNRGKRNEPAFLPLVAARVAELQGNDVKTVARKTTENAQRLFGFSYRAIS